jgi:hypothetical protein
VLLAIALGLKTPLESRPVQNSLLHAKFVVDRTLFMGIIVNSSSLYREETREGFGQKGKIHSLFPSSSFGGSSFCSWLHRELSPVVATTYVMRLIANSVGAGMRCQRDHYDRCNCRGSSCSGSTKEHRGVQKLLLDQLSMASGGSQGSSKMEISNTPRFQGLVARL